MKLEGLLGWLILALPLAGALVLGLLPNEPSKAFVRIVGCGSMFAAFALTVALFIDQAGHQDEVHTSTLWRWIDIGDAQVDLAIRIDQLSVMMMLVITGVGFLIHLYSTEYMAHEGGYRKFFAQMNFFVFSMLVLVEAANVVFLIVGWALVGLASYLLIGFYNDRPSAVAAARKAFVINVIGDIGLVIGAFVLLDRLGTLDYDGIFNGIANGGLSRGAAEAVALLFFVGAAAKSAQIPLHTWLPDAMEGPTPVSALIHAATMVTAGVYLTVRFHLLYGAAPSVSQLVAIVGALTLIMAATIACVQVDIKRVLAWSTVSQIGYMMMGAGLGAYSASMFHLVTHAFFKACLFLGAGIVIHALRGEQSLDKMGGLWRHLKPVGIMMAVGCMAIAGVPGLSGFFSKDAILAHAWNAGSLGKFCWVVGIVTAGITAFYMFRLFFRTFAGPEPEGGIHHLHKPGWAMSVPVGILAVAAAIGGLFEVPGAWVKITDWLEPITADITTKVPELTHRAEWITGIASTAVGLGGIALAWWMFGAGSARRLRMANVLPGYRSVLQDAYGFDDIQTGAVVETTKSLGDVLRDKAEPHGAQGLVIAAQGISAGAGRLVNRTQSGLIRGYAGAMIGGVAILGLVIVLVSQ